MSLSSINSLKSDFNRILVMIWYINLIRRGRAFSKFLSILGSIYTKWMFVFRKTIVIILNGTVSQHNWHLLRSNILWRKWKFHSARRPCHVSISNSGSSRTKVICFCWKIARTVNKLNEQVSERPSKIQLQQKQQQQNSQLGHTNE